LLNNHRKSMMEFKRGNLLEEDVEALVNTVNCVGVMGRGIALQFKQAFPENFKRYKKACDAGEVEPGKMFVVETGQILSPRYIVNFPTKQHWKGNSKLADIRSGLRALVLDVAQLGIRSIAIPPLGCGNGGLDWAVVRPLIVEAFSELPDVRVVVFEMGQVPASQEMAVGTQLPTMTRGRALVVSLFEQYGLPGYALGRLEAQKLVYFLKEAGEPFERLSYVKHQYGPYAEVLNHALQGMEGHYIRGYGDRTAQSEMVVLPQGKRAADAFLQGDREALERLERVSRLIEGFETPYGMEMLATLHWVVTRENPGAADDVEVAIALVHSWNERKARIFKVPHLRKGWARLKEQGWLEGSIDAGSEIAGEDQQFQIQPPTDQ
jgi:O-acetyl-ADP-ribose deacetylase (regulator of RNase III)